jgi:DNA-binding transcriptional ArsR family regulator
MPHAKHDVFDGETVSLSLFARALSHPARIKILTFLQQRGQCPCMEIVEVIPLSQPSVSRHIAALEAANLIQSKVRGNEILYSIKKDRIHKFCSVFSKTLKPKK